MRRQRKRPWETKLRTGKSACVKAGKGKTENAGSPLSKLFRESSPEIPIVIPLKAVGTLANRTLKPEKRTGLYGRSASPKQLSKGPGRVVIRKGGSFGRRRRNTIRTGTYSVHVSPDRMRDYLPVTQEPFREVGASEMAEVKAKWGEIIRCGRSYRDEAIEAVGPMLTPQDAAKRLGVSKATLSNWRRQNKLLGVNFDDHQYLYPVWQFVDSPLEGEHGVLRFLRQVLLALGNPPPWEKALFVVTQSPSFDGRTPLEVLRSRRKEDIDRLCEVALHSGEMGS